MAAALKFYDYIPGARREPGFRELRLATERVSAREIIQRRVEEEVEAFNRNAEPMFRGLVQPAGSDRVGAAFRVPAQRRIDAAEQVRIACEAFERRRFVLLFDERQLETLDETVVLDGDNTVTFLRLVPLVGG